MSDKPIRVFFSELDGHFYATRHYQERQGAVVITGKKYDVTQDIAAAIHDYDISFHEAPDPDDGTQEIENDTGTAPSEGGK